VISKRRIASSSVLRGVDVAFQVLSTLWITPLIIHALGKERYGLWVTVLTMVSYIDIFDFGITNAVTRYVSRAIGKKDATEVTEVIRTAFSILLAIGICCTVLVGGLAVAGPWLAPGNSDPVLVRQIILIIGLVTALSFPMRVFAGVLEAHVRYELTTTASILRTILNTLALWWVANHGANLLHVVFVTAASGLFQRALNYLFARRVEPAMRLFPVHLSGPMTSVIMAYGWKNFLLKLIDQVRFRIDNLVIARFVNLSAVAIYAPGMSLIRLFRQAMDCLGGVFMPVFSSAEGAGDRVRLANAFSGSLKAAAVLSTYVGGMLVLYGGWFMDRWLGTAFHESYRVMLVIGVPTILAMSQLPGLYLLFALSKQEKLVRLHAVEGIINFVLSLALVKPYGIYGVALGTAIPLAISKCVVQPWLVCGEIGMSVRRYYLQSILVPTLVAGVPMVLLHFALLPWVRADYLRLAEIGVVQTVAVGASALFLLTDRVAREKIMSLLRRR
jgi:O-antigen/teichoic acid export membrane protein